MEIIKLDPSQKKKAAKVIARAFFNYPMMTFYFPDPRRRSRYLAWYMGCVLNCALRYGEVYTTPEIAGTVFILPPGHTKITLWEYLQNGFAIAPLVWGLRNYARLMVCDAYLEKAHEALLQGKPHYYLWGLTVDPSHQGKGIGMALLEPVFAKADANKLPIYLETHDEKNVAYYQNRGFSMIRADRDPKYGLPFWCMVRDPC